jgi:hypothetical protein
MTSACGARGDANQRRIQPDGDADLFGQIRESGENACSGDGGGGFCLGAFASARFPAAEIAGKPVEGDRSDGQPAAGRPAPVIAHGGLAPSRKRSIQPGLLAVRPVNTKVFEPEPNGLAVGTSRK